MLGVSIVMATFNGSRFLRTQLTSLANQKKQPTELIICDDRSSDDTVGIAAEFANGSPFLSAFTSMKSGRVIEGTSS
jgi:glycosyltransferase involved in cell wall biosynthesis